MLSALAYVANWRFLADGQSYAALFRTPSPVLHFWSLAIEEQFYLAFPIVVAVVMGRARSPRRALLATLLALGVASVTLQLTASGFDRVYYGTDTRLFEIVAGAVLAPVAYERRDAFTRMPAVAPVVGLVSLAAFVGLVARAQLGASWIAHGGLALVGLLNVVLIVSVLAPGVWSRALAFRPLVAIGRVSYGLYLIHWPVFLWLDERRTGHTGVALLAERLAVVVPLTVVSYHLLECPVRFGRRLRTPRRFAATLAGGLAAAIVLVLALPTTVVASFTDPTALRLLRRRTRGTPACDGRRRLDRDGGRAWHRGGTRPAPRRRRRDPTGVHADQHRVHATACFRPTARHLGVRAARPGVACRGPALPTQPRARGLVGRRRRRPRDHPNRVLRQRRPHGPVRTDDQRLPDCGPTRCGRPEPSSRGPTFPTTRSRALRRCAVANISTRASSCSTPRSRKSRRHSSAS